MAKAFNDGNSNSQILFATKANLIEPLYEVQFFTSKSIRDQTNFIQNFWAQNAFLQENEISSNSWRDPRFGKFSNKGYNVRVLVDADSWEYFNNNDKVLIIIEGCIAEYKALDREYNLHSETSEAVTNSNQAKNNAITNNTAGVQAMEDDK